MSFWVFRIIVCVCLAVPATSSAGGIFIGPGSSVTLGDGSVDLGCNDINIDGQLDIGSGSIRNISNFAINGGDVSAGSGEIQLTGDWYNDGVYYAGTSKLSIIDGCAKSISAISGDNDFHAFSATSMNGKMLQIEAGSKQVFKHSLALVGRVDEKLLIRSSAPGFFAFFSLLPNATQNIFAVNVEDNNAQGGMLLAPEIPVVLASVDAGHNVSWFLNGVGAISDALPIPTLSPWALIIFVSTLMSAVFGRRHLLTSRG